MLIQSYAILRAYDRPTCVNYFNYFSLQIDKYTLIIYKGPLLVCIIMIIGDLVAGVPRVGRLAKTKQKGKSKAAIVVLLLV